jgi:hypothetical protein
MQNIATPSRGDYYDVIMPDGTISESTESRGCNPFGIITAIVARKNIRFWYYRIKKFSIL